MIIYRSFTFYNYKMNAKEDTTNAEYVALDFFDRFHTERIDVNYKENELYKLWKYSSKEYKRLDGNYSYQNVFGFRYQRQYDISNDYDERFWDTNSTIFEKYPLTFVTLIQLQNNDNDSNKTYKFGNQEFNLPNLCKQIEDKINALFKKILKCICYYTVDKNDLIVAIKSKSYSSQFKVLNFMHSNIKYILYSYTIMLLSNKLLNGFNIENVENQKIDSICIKAVYNNESESNSSDYHDISSAFFKKLTNLLYKGNGNIQQNIKIKDNKLYDIFGSYDCRYIARNVPLRNLIKAYSKGELLDKVSNNFSKYFYIASTSLNLRNLRYSKLAFSNSFIQPLYVNQDLFIYKILMSKCKYLYQKIDGIIKQYYDKNLDDIISTYFQTLNQLIATISSMELVATDKTTLYSLSYFMYLLIDFLNKSINNFNECLQLANSKELYTFLHGLSSTINGTLRTDIQFFQVSSFNAITHYAPDKLKAIYNAIAYFYTQLYDSCCDESDTQEGESDKKRYAFIVSPGLYDKIGIRSLVINQDSTIKNDYGIDLHLICMPERHLYKPVTNFIVLGHEVAHRTGTCLRQREARFKCVFKAIHYVVFDIINSTLLNSVSINNDTLYNKIWEILFKNRFLVDKYKFSINQNINLIDFEDYHSYKLKNDMYWCIAKILQNELDNIINEFVNILRKTINQDVDEELMNTMDKYCKEIKKNGKKNITNCWTECGIIIIDQIFDLLSECFADICSILSLDLSFIEYVESFVKSDYIAPSNKNPFGTDISDLLIIRIYIVQKVMTDNPNEKWKLEENYSNYLYNCLSAYRNVVEHREKYNNLIYEKGEEGKDVIQLTYGKSELDLSNTNIGYLWFLFNLDVCNNMLSYLVTCKNYFVDHIQNGSEEFKNHLDNIRDLFKGVKEFESNPDIINKILLRYKKQLFKELEKWKN